MKNKKILGQKRRSRKIRGQIRRLDKIRLTVKRSSQHIYAQVIAADSKTVLASASTLDKELRGAFGGNVAAAKAVGQLVAKRALEKGIKAVAFDRSGYAYHGRVKALADAAREGGVEF